MRTWSEGGGRENGASAALKKPGGSAAIKVSPQIIAEEDFSTSPPLAMGTFLLFPSPGLGKGSEKVGEGREETPFSI